MEEKDLGAIREAFEYSYTQFSLNLLRESRKQVQNGEDAKNTMVCPLSVMMALEMARTGAATVVEMCKETAMVEQPERIILDRPFLYAIVEKDTGIPVFIGTVESF